MRCKPLEEFRRWGAVIDVKNGGKERWFVSLEAELHQRIELWHQLFFDFLVDAVNQLVNLRRDGRVCCMTDAGLMDVSYDFEHGLP